MASFLLLNVATFLEDIMATMTDAGDVLVDVHGMLCRWIANFTSADVRLYRASPGAAYRLVGPPHAVGRLSAEDLARRGLVGAYEPVMAPAVP